MNLLSLSGATIIFAVTVLFSLVGLYAYPRLIERSLFRPYWFIRERQYETIVTSGLAHGDLSHLVFNMVTFWFFAFQLERHIGQIAFGALYGLGLLLSHMCTYQKQKSNPNYASLGASGAISAVLFAYIVYFPTTTLLILPFPFPIPAVLFALGYVAYSFWASKQSRGRINHDAHLCGAISGVIFVAVTDHAAFADLARLLQD